MIVDDHEVVREGLKTVLRVPGQIRVIGTVGTAQEALQLVERVMPDVALVDLRLPDMSGIDLCRELISARPRLAVILLSSYLSEEVVRSALQAGAAAYVTKAAGLTKLRETIEQVGGFSPKPDVTQAPVIVQQLHQLSVSRSERPTPSPRQTRVLELAAQGFTNGEIGASLFISESTVRFHIQNLKTLLNAKTKTDLIVRAIRSGIIEPAPEAQARQ